MYNLKIKEHDAALFLLTQKINLLSKIYFLFIVSVYTIIKITTNLNRHKELSLSHFEKVKYLLGHYVTSFKRLKSFFTIAGTKMFYHFHLSEKICFNKIRLTLLIILIF